MKITYKEHYKMCRDVNPIKGGKYKSLYDLTVDSDVLGKIDSELVKRIHTQMCEKIDANDGCRKQTHAIRVDSWRDIPEVFTLLEHIMPSLESQVFGCPAKIEHVHLYRNIPADMHLENEWDTDHYESSWKWHYDDCPQEFLKILINLNQVSEDSGCFKYMVNSFGKAEIIPSYRLAPGFKARSQVYPSSRIPKEVIRDKINKGWSIVNFVGQPGSYAVCTPNIYHRASVPKIGTDPRDVMFLFVRPTLKNSDQYTSSDPDWGGTPEKNVKGYEVN